MIIQQVFLATQQSLQPLLSAFGVFQSAHDAMGHVVAEAHHVGSREGKQWC